jgi:hypothetical protein
VIFGEVDDAAPSVGAEMILAFAHAVEQFWSEHEQDRFAPHPAARASATAAVTAETFARPRHTGFSRITRRGFIIFLS